MSGPKRIQMSRQRPWRAASPAAVIVARPSKWGNPFAARIPHGEVLQGRETRAVLVEQYRRWLVDGASADEAVASFPLLTPQGNLWVARMPLVSRPTLREIRAELAGRDLACWCPLDSPCHGDVLLALARGDDYAPQPTPTDLKCAPCREAGRCF